MAALGRVVGRDAHQPVHAALGLEVAVGVLAVDLDRGVLDAGLVAGLQVEHAVGRSRGARPSAGTCGTASRPSPATRCRRRPGWIDDDRAEPVVLARQQALELEVGDPRLERVELALRPRRACARRPRPRRARAAPSQVARSVCRGPSQSVDRALGALQRARRSSAPRRAGPRSRARAMRASSSATSRRRALDVKGTSAACRAWRGPARGASLQFGGRSAWSQSRLPQVGAAAARQRGARAPGAAPRVRRACLEFRERAVVGDRRRPRRRARRVRRCAATRAPRASAAIRRPQREPRAPGAASARRPRAPRRSSRSSPQSSSSAASSTTTPREAPRAQRSGSRSSMRAEQRAGGPAGRAARAPPASANTRAADARAVERAVRPVARRPRTRRRARARTSGSRSVTSWPIAVGVDHDRGRAAASTRATVLLPLPARPTSADDEQPVAGVRAAARSVDIEPGRPRPTDTSSGTRSGSQRCVIASRDGRRDRLGLRGRALEQQLVVHLQQQSSRGPLALQGARARGSSRASSGRRPSPGSAC